MCHLAIDDYDDAEFRRFKENALSIFDQPSEISVIFESDEAAEKVENPHSVSSSFVEDDGYFGSKDQSSTKTEANSIVRSSESGGRGFRNFLNKIFRTSRRERLYDKADRKECFKKNGEPDDNRYHRSASADELDDRKCKSLSLTYLHKQQRKNTSTSPIQSQRRLSESSLPHSTLPAKCSGSSVDCRGGLLLHASKQGR